MPDAALQGDAELMAFMRESPKEARKGARKGVLKSAQIMTITAAMKAPKESRLLAQSIGQKVKTYGKSGNVVGIIGPRKEVVGEYKGKKRWPVKYAHLVEGGHVDAKTKKHVPAKPFLRPAYEETKDQATEYIAGAMWDGIEKTKGASK